MRKAQSMNFRVSPAAQALLGAHLSTAATSLMALSLVMNALDVESLQVWFTWVGLLAWFSAVIDSGLSQCAFRRVAATGDFGFNGRGMHALVVLARALLLPTACLLLVALVEPARQAMLLPPTLVAAIGLALSANWAMPLLQRPQRCAAVVALLQVMSLGAYWTVGRMESGIALFAWVFAITQLCIALAYAAFLYFQTTQPSDDRVSLRSALRLLKQSIPLSFASIITLPYSSAVPLVSAFMSSGELAKFAIVERIVKAAQALQVPIGQSMLPGTYAMHADPCTRRNRLRFVLAVQITSAMASVVVLVACGDWFLRVWTGRAWPGVIWTIAPMAGAIVCTAITNALSQHVLIPNGRDGVVLGIVAAAGLASFLLLPLVAPAGAPAVATAILGVECFVLLAYGVAYLWMREGKTSE